MVLISIAGSASAWRLIVPLVVTAGTPSRTSAASKLVPPMSTVMKLLRRSARMHASPATGAAAGPDSKVIAASADTARGEATPPFDCMINSTPR